MQANRMATPSIDYVETGSGPAVLFIPGSFSTPAAWRPIQKLMPPIFRLIGTSLCGYGATPETRTHDDFGMHHELRIIEQAARRIGGPVHLVGHSFGGSVALAAALAGSIDVVSLAIFEANPLALFREQARKVLYQEIRTLSHEFKAAVDAGKADAASIIIDFWGGPGTFASMPEIVRNYCRETVRANVLDWQTGFGFDASLRDYAAMDIPVLLVRGGQANPAMVAVTQTLQHTLPNVHAAVVEGAGHFLITTHAAECAALLARFLATVGNRQALEAGAH
jgi:pimeloyl-ACP methyl ester carboxylesterase